MHRINFKDVVAFASFNRLNKRNYARLYIILLYVSQGGVKVLITGPWQEASSEYTCLFDQITVPASLIQPGVLRCYCPGISSQSHILTACTYTLLQLSFWRESVILLHFSIPKASNKVKNK